MFGFPLGILAMIFFVLLMIVFFLCRGESFVNELDDRIYRYQMTEFDPMTNSTSKGFVKMNHKIKNDFMSFVGSSGKFVTISDFVDMEFECFGGCKCNTDRRYAGVGAINRGLFVIVSAISTIAALRIAKDYFTEKCVDEVEECDKDEIDLEVYRCEFDSSKLEKKDRVIYECEGHCLTNLRVNTDDLLQKAREFKCEDWEYMGEVDFRIFEDTRSNALRKAKSLFRKIHLGPYCKDVSLFKDPKNAKKGRYVSLCSSTQKGIPLLSNVRCVKRSDYVLLE